jgi:ABC-2 type transport system ATP-binding protein
MNSIIEVEGLCKSFDKKNVVDNLSFTVNQGDVYGFLGQNGAGKSTTIRMLLTLIKPTLGSIKILGKPLQNNRQEILSQIGALIEKPDLYKYLSAYHNLQIFAKLSGCNLSKQELHNKLDQVGLLHRANDKVKTFSQGMKQRLGIAIALVHNPQIIILDEPTNGLDPQGIADIRHLIKSLSEEFNKTVVVSSHLLNEIEQIATKILIIDKGKKIIEGKKDDLFDINKTVVDIATTSQNVLLQYLSLTQWQQCLDTQHDLQNVRLLVNKNQIPLLIKDIVNQGIDIFSVEQRHSLEDYFLKVTKGNYVQPV